MPSQESFDAKRNLKTYLRFLRPYRWLFAAVLASVLVSEAMTTADKFLLKVVVDKGSVYAQGGLGVQAFLHALALVGALFLLVVAVRSASNWLMLHLVNRLEARLILDVKKHYFLHLVKLSHRFHTTNRTGSLISRMTRGGGAVERLTDAVVFQFAPLIFQAIVVGSSLLFFDLSSAMIVFSTTTIFIIFSVMLQRLLRRANVEANEAEDYEKGTVADLFTNIESIKFFGKEEAVFDRYHKVASVSKEKMLRHWHYYRWTSAGQILILGVGTMLLLFSSLSSFIAGSISIGTLIFIYTAYANLANPLYGFVRGVREYYRAMADIDPLFRYGLVENEVKDRSGAGTLAVSKGAIEFSGVTFGYDRRRIFDGFSLRIQPRTRVALVGHSGCGKTTLVKLLYRFYDVQAGGIAIDGQDVRGVSQGSLRGGMSIVPQECVLFDDSVYNNIAFSRPQASRSQVLAAIRAAQLDRVVATFPDGVETVVGERGVKLSGGEKQRVSIARALLADKRILVLDEATSSLDSQTEHDIQRALGRLMRGRTTIIIAHRLSTIMAADLIVVLRKGRIVQMGSHRQLLRQGGEYRKLWNLQKGGYLKE